MEINIFSGKFYKKTKSFPSLGKKWEHCLISKKREAGRSKDKVHSPVMWLYLSIIKATSKRWGELNQAKLHQDLKKKLLSSSWKGKACFIIKPWKRHVPSLVGKTVFHLEKQFPFRFASDGLGRLNRGVSLFYSWCMRTDGKRERKRCCDPYYKSGVYSLIPAAIWRKQTQPHQVLQWMQR